MRQALSLGLPLSCELNYQSKPLYVSCIFTGLFWQLFLLGSALVRVKVLECQLSYTGSGKGTKFGNLNPRILSFSKPDGAVCAFVATDKGKNESLLHVLLMSFSIWLSAMVHKTIAKVAEA